MRALLNRDEFREFLQAHATDRFQRGCTASCPIARYLVYLNGEAVQVFSDHYAIGSPHSSYILPLWAKNFILKFDNHQGDGLTLTGARALLLLGPEDEDDDEHPGRAMLDESPPHEPDESSPDYDEELEDSETESDYEDDSE